MRRDGFRDANYSFMLLQHQLHFHLNNMDQNVYQGLWTNWSRGPILGPTITISKEYGNLLIAFTAIFIAFVSSRFWNILCLILHRCYSTANPQSQDAIYHQRQIVLRNSPAAESALISFVQVLWAWRRSSKKRLILFAVPVLLALMSFAAFTIAGGFSATISTSVGNDVLVQSTRCGIPGAIPSDIASQTIEQTFNADMLNSAATYAQQCYNESVSSLSHVDCNKFVVDRIPTAEIDFNAGCPFDDRICRTPNSNIRLDSGLIDSSVHLGLNAPANQRYKRRYVLHCAPLETEGYTSNGTEEGKGWVKYHYGTKYFGPLENLTMDDFVWKVKDVNSQYERLEHEYLTGKNYRLGYFQSRSTKFFDPIPELVRTDGDLVLMFLSGNGVVFSEPMDDGWYRATVPFYNMSKTPLTGTMLGYRPDEAAFPMGCVEQWQWCNAAYSQGCGPLAGMVESLDAAAPLFNMTEEELAPNRPLSNDSTASRLVWAGLITVGYPSVLSTVMASLELRSLSSQSNMYGGVQWPLPNNQWKLDVVHWWNILHAQLQAAYVNTAVGPANPALDQFSWTPSSDEEKKLCKNQKIRSTAYVSFSLFGICFTYTTGVLIIGASYILEPVLSCLHRRRRYKQYAHLEWVSNTSLQLHRLANEALEIGKWSHSTDTIPTTDLDTTLAYLDITDVERPVLNRVCETPRMEKQEPRGSSHGSCRGQVENKPSNIHTTQIRHNITVEVDREAGSDGASVVPDNYSVSMLSTSQGGEPDSRRYSSEETRLAESIQHRYSADAEGD